MRLLCNENIPAAAVRKLRDAGHDALSIAETHPGIKDREVLEIAHAEERICVTFDKDFGELAAANPASGRCGIVLLRLPAGPAAGIGDKIAAAIASRDDWAGHFSVIAAGSVRMRRLG